MARKRGSAAGATGVVGCGLPALLIPLAIVYVIVNYWWVLVLLGGVAVAVVAIVRNARQPRIAPPPRPDPRLLKPGPQKGPALSQDQIYLQMRAAKRASHRSEMARWDEEFARLLK